MKIIVKYLKLNFICVFPQYVCTVCLTPVCASFGSCIFICTADSVIKYVTRSKAAVKKFHRVSIGFKSGL